ncbi:hypothetical protein E2C01_073464 [Portunus trituberculatus]|uniref:Uncharacterized protein n=1 Tax=Portunus trituberculatus TaxID=210409 RepID=A0A5B7I9T4_PORTR|nr:hypothetical protein [Portunus trituberculatus]
MLQEARQRAMQEEKDGIVGGGNNKNLQKPSFEQAWEATEGPVHLEALSLVAKQCQTKRTSMAATLPHYVQEKLLRENTVIKVYNTVHRTFKYVCRLQAVIIGKCQECYICLLTVVYLVIVVVVLGMFCEGFGAPLVACVGCAQVEGRAVRELVEGGVVVGTLCRHRYIFVVCSRFTRFVVLFVLLLLHLYYKLSRHSLWLRPK